MIAIDGVDVTVASGEIVGLLGPNGAGKTTVLECLLGLREPDAGEILLDGVDLRSRPRDARRRLGAQLQPSALQDKITPREALRFNAALHHVSTDLDQLLARFGLTEKADAHFDTLSAGQRQRLALALAFVHAPALLVLDEPTTGLDPQTRRALHEILRAHRASGGGILLSTHDLDEAERLCDRVAVLHRSRLVATDSPAALIARAGQATRIRFRTARPFAMAGLRSDDAGVRHQISTPEQTRTVATIVRGIESTGNELLELQLAPPTLEDAFVALTGESWERPTEAEA
jgi:ABC-2 type transport system ATP-binding protein